MAEAASVYRACAERNLSPRDVDELELWEIAAFLGVDVPPDDDSAQVRSGSAPRRKRDLNAERVAYAQGRGPKPEPDEPDPSMNILLTQMDRTIGR